MVKTFYAVIEPDPEKRVDTQYEFSVAACCKEQAFLKCYRSHFLGVQIYDKKAGKLLIDYKCGEPLLVCGCDK